MKKILLTCLLLLFFPGFVLGANLEFELEKIDYQDYSSHYTSTSIYNNEYNHYSYSPAYFEYHDNFIYSFSYYGNMIKFDKEFNVKKYSAGHSNDSIIYCNSVFFELDGHESDIFVRDENDYITTLDIGDYLYNYNMDFKCDSNQLYIDIIFDKSNNSNKIKRKEVTINTNSFEYRVNDSEFNSNFEDNFIAYPYKTSLTNKGAIYFQNDENACIYKDIFDNSKKLYCGLFAGVDLNDGRIMAFAPVNNYSEKLKLFILDVKTGSITDIETVDYSDVVLRPYIADNNILFLNKELIKIKNKSDFRDIGTLNVFDYKEVIDQLDSVGLKKDEVNIIQTILHEDKLYVFLSSSDTYGSQQIYLKYHVKGLLQNQPDSRVKGEDKIVNPKTGLKTYTWIIGILSVGIIITYFIQAVRSRKKI